jgi:hypothetical protein
LDEAAHTPQGSGRRDGGGLREFEVGQGGVFLEEFQQAKVNGVEIHA